MYEVLMERWVDLSMTIFSVILPFSLALTGLACVTILIACICRAGKDDHH